MENRHSLLRSQRHLASALVLGILLWAPAAAADETPEPSPAAEAAAETRELRVPWTEPAGRGLAIGLDNGLWGSGYGQSVRLRVPFSANWGMNVRGVAVHGISDEPYRFSALGSLELFGCTPVYLNLLRIYGGGGPRVGARVVGPDAGQLVVGGGGQAGIEAFLTKGMSFYFEIGGTGGPRQLAGATAVGGMSFYL